MMRKWKKTDKGTFPMEKKEQKKKDYKGNPTQIGQFTIWREVTNLVKYPCP